MSAAQQVLLVVLRTLIGWHFLYEGYVKLLRPAWGPGWCAARRRGHRPAISVAPPVRWHASSIRSPIQPGSGRLIRPLRSRLRRIGLSLLLGLFTRLGCIGAMLLLTLFYVTRDPDERRAGTAARRRVSLRQQDADRARRRRRRLCLPYRTHRGPGSLVGRGPADDPGAHSRRSRHESHPGTHRAGTAQLSEDSRGHAGAGGARRVGRDEGAGRRRTGPRRLHRRRRSGAGPAQERRSRRLPRFGRSATSTRRA